MRVNPTRKKHVRSGTGNSFFDGIQRTIRNAMHVHKKDDDWNDFGDSGRRNNTSLLAKLSKMNPLFLLIGVCMTLAAIVAFIIFIFTALFGSDSAQSSLPISQVNIVKRDGFNPSQATENMVEVEIEAILEKFAHSGSEIETKLSLDLDIMTAGIVHNYCLNELPFDLDFDAKSTLEAHVHFIISEILNKDSFTEVSVENTVVTDRGTLIDPKKNPEKIGNSAYAKCSLIEALLTKAKAANIMKAAGKNEEDHFGFTNDEAWNGHKELFSNKDINEAAFELISLATENGENNHLARQLVGGLIDEFCPQMTDFLPTELNAQGNEPKVQMINAVNDLLIQLKMEGNIHLGKNEIPGIDKSGHLVAVNKFSMDKEEKFGKTYTTCSILDKIAFFHNVDIEKQCRVLMNNVRMDNFYAFENQADIMMLQRCPTTVSVLKSQKMGNGDLYHSIFRGELLSFALKVSNNEFMSKDTENFVVSNDGGIMHQHAVQSAFTKCDIINILAKMSDLKSGQYDEQQFNPNEHTLPPKIVKQKTSSTKNEYLEEDAKSIIDYAVKNQQYELRHLLSNMLYVYHPNELQKLSADQTEDIISEINQYLTTLLDIDYNAHIWPDTFRTAIDMENGNLMLLDESDEKMKKETMIQSELITKVFELALRQPRRPKKKSVKPTISAGTAATDDAGDDDEMNAYLAVLKDDIKTKANIVDLKKTIAEDLEHWCKGLIGSNSHLNEGRAERVFWSKLLPMLQKGNIVINAVVTKDGQIQSKQSDNSGAFECKFLKKLLN